MSTTVSQNAPTCQGQAQLIVDWTTSQLVAYASRPDKPERRYRCLCGQCGREYWLRRCDIRKAINRGSPCGVCQRRQAGKNGYAATKAKHGRRMALQFVAGYQRSHLSRPEAQVRDWLKAAFGPDLESQHIFVLESENFGVIIDFVVRFGVQWVAIEV